MNYSLIQDCDIANGEGVRVSLFVSGCRNHCDGCFNPETWDFNHGRPFTKQTEDILMEMCKPKYIDGLTILGGDPMEPDNQKALLPFLERFTQAYPNKTIWLYTGYVVSDDCQHISSCADIPGVTDKILSLVDVVVDGPFIKELKDVDLKFRGSSNQRILYLKAESMQHFL